ncbi:hypothetical protein D3C84_804060 [compost metagenome]
MIKSFEFLFTVVLIGVSVCVIGMVLWFVIGMGIAFWKVYVRGPEGGIVPKKCKHASSSYTDSHPDKPWTCNDCKNIHS